MPIAPLAAGAAGVLTAGVFALMPTGMLESLVIDSGVAAVVAAAEPPLGFTARALLILACGGGVALITWFGLFLLLGSRSILVQRSRAAGDDTAPVLRRADAHPDAPARRPVFANRDLGTPFLDVRAERPAPVVVDSAPVSPPVGEPASEPRPLERDLPVDLDMPLAAYDPEAIPDAPIDWFPPTAPLPASARQQVFESGERFESFPLTPMVRTVRAPIAAEPAPVPAAPDLSRPDTPQRDPAETIHDLLARLERGMARREPAGPPPREESLQDTLVMLRRLATRAG